MKETDINVLIEVNDVIIDRMDNNARRTISGFSGSTVHFTDGGVMDIDEIRPNDVLLESEAAQEIDFTQAEYDEALIENNFSRAESRFPGHVRTTLADGTTGHFCEAAALDNNDTLRDAVDELIESRDWENAQRKELEA